MVIYLDLVFFLNGCADAIALYITARLSGFPIHRRKLLVGAIVGGGYGVLSMLPFLSFTRSFWVQFIFALFMVRLVFGKEKTLLRVALLFLLLSCTLGGAMVATTQYIEVYGLVNSLQRMDWKVFFLVSGFSFLVITLIFRGSASHAITGQICQATICLGKKRVCFHTLLDTGHTLRDPFTGAPVLTVWVKALEPLWSDEENRILTNLEELGCLWCAEKMGTLLQGKFFLIPYRAVGIDHAMLLAFRADSSVVNGEQTGALTIALSPTPVSDGGSYSALWGGEGRAPDAV